MMVEKLGQAKGLPPRINRIRIPGARCRSQALRGNARVDMAARNSRDYTMHFAKRLLDRIGIGRRSKDDRAIVVGAFSFPDWWATFGDTEAMFVVAEWLEESGLSYDLACDSSVGIPGVDIFRVDPADYTIFIYVCGPWNDAKGRHLLARFGHCRKIGVNLSVLNERSHGFDVLYARDMGTTSNPDLAFARETTARHPVVGVCLVHPQEEYGDRQRHHIVSDVVSRYFEESGAIRIEMDTLCVNNSTSVRTLEQFESLASRVDFVISSRLHGLVLSLRTGIPVIALDPIAGGGKVSAQARAIEWPLLLPVEDLSVARMREMATRCTAGAMKPYVDKSLQIARQHLARTKREFMGAVQPSR